MLKNELYVNVCNYGVLPHAPGPLCAAGRRLMFTPVLRHNTFLRGTLLLRRHTFPRWDARGSNHLRNHLSRLSNGILRCSLYGPVADLTYHCETGQGNYRPSVLLLAALRPRYSARVSGQHRRPDLFSLYGYPPRRHASFIPVHPGTAMHIACIFDYQRHRCPKPYLTAAGN